MTVLGLARCDLVTDPSPNRRIEMHTLGLAAKTGGRTAFRPISEAQAPALASPQRHHRESVRPCADSLKPCAAALHRGGVHPQFPCFGAGVDLSVRRACTLPLCVAEAPSLYGCSRGCLNAPLRLLAIDSRETAIDGVAELGSSWRPTRTSKGAGTFKGLHRMKKHRT